jgi:hypothetical protein
VRQAIPVLTDYTAGEVRRSAQRAKDAAQARRLLAIAAREACTRHIGRSVVSRRDAGGPKEQAHRSLGQGRFTPPCRRLATAKPCSTALDPWMAERAVGGSQMPSACRRSLMPEILRRCKRLRHRLELKVSLPHALAQDVNIRCSRGIGMCRLQMRCRHNSLSWL